MKKSKKQKEIKNFPNSISLVQMNKVKGGAEMAEYMILLIL